MRAQELIEAIVKALPAAEAKTAIAVANALKPVAEMLAELRDACGLSQRKIAAAVGKSVGWVNALLKWRAAGFVELTPFIAARRKATVQRAEQREAVQRDEQSADVQRAEHSDDQGADFIITPDIRATLAEYVAAMKAHAEVCARATPDYMNRRRKDPASVSFRAERERTRLAVLRARDRLDCALGVGDGGRTLAEYDADNDPEIEIAADEARGVAAAHEITPEVEIAPAIVPEIASECPHGLPTFCCRLCTPPSKPSPTTSPGTEVAADAPVRPVRPSDDLPMYGDDTHPAWETYDENWKAYLLALGRPDDMDYELPAEPEMPSGDDDDLASPAMKAWRAAMAEYHSECSARRQAARTAREAWDKEHAELLASERAADDITFRKQCPEDAAEQDADNAKRAAATAKRIKSESKNPERALEKAMDDAIKDAMGGDRDEAKQEARENGERWGDVSEDWEADWIETNWDEEARQEAYDDFKKQWVREHPDIACPELQQEKETVS